MNALIGFAQGMEAGNQIQTGRARNALTSALQSGDRQGAFNALTTLDPMAAYQAQQPDMKARREAAGSLIKNISRLPPEQQPEAWAQAVQRAPQLGIEVPPELAQYPGPDGVRGLAMYYDMQDGERSEFERLTAGLSPEEQATAIRRRLGLEADANATLRAGAEPRDPIAALRLRAQEAGLRPGTAEYSQFMVNGGAGQQGFAVDTAPDGSVSIRQGAGAGAVAKPFTEGQSKDNVYTTRALGALGTLDPIADALTSLGNRAADYDPTGIVRGAVQDDRYQVAKNAGDEFLQAILRKDTGAAITSQEQQLYGQTYLPQPGDNAAVMQQKAQARRRAVEAIKAGVSPAQMVAIEKGLAASNSPALGAAPQSPLMDLSDDDLKALLGTQ